MKAVWKRIRDWLDANAPAGYGDLRPGATAELIREAENALGLKLPADVKASYRVHDGQSNEPGLIGGEGWCLFSLQGMVAHHQRWSQGKPKNAHKVPIACIATGDYVFLDLDPESESRGRLMIQRRDRRKPDPLAPSFRAWLEEFADNLENDAFAYSEDDEIIMYADELDLD